MSKIKSKNTIPEILLKNALRGTYLRHHSRGILGNPDFASKKYLVAVFVDGDFWHGYNWKILGKIPPKGFWQGKINRNMKRDREYNKKLKDIGWTVIRFWEHEVKQEPVNCASKIKKSLRN